MKKIILLIVVIFLYNRIDAQEKLTISQAIAYKVACYSGGNLEGQWLDVFGRKVLGKEYTDAINSNDEFKLNRLKKTLNDKYAEAIESVNIGSIYYVTELIDNYNYDFSTSSVKISFGTTDEFGRLTSTNDYNKLDVYIEGGVRRNFMTNGYESDDNPVFRISNADNIPRLFEMPVDIAEKSFAQRKGNNRPAFKLRYYFKFWQCGSKFEIINFGGYSCDVEVVKVELIDEIVNYKKIYNIEPGEQPSGAPKQVLLSASDQLTKTFDYQLRSNGDEINKAFADGNKVLMEKLLKQRESIEQQRLNFVYKYIIENTSSLVAANLARKNINQFDFSQLETIAKGFDPSINESPDVQDLIERYKVLLSVSIGKSFIDFTMNNKDGNPVRFSTLLKGRYTLVDFWAAWCGPCRKENPNIVAIYNDYKSKGFDVIGISLDQDKEKWLKAIETDKLSWHQISDLQYWHNAAAKLYGVTSIPYNILLDDKGIIIAKNIRGEELRRKISELLHD